MSIFNWLSDLIRAICKEKGFVGCGCDSRFARELTLKENEHEN